MSPLLGASSTPLHILVGAVAGWANQFLTRLVKLLFNAQQGGIALSTILEDYFLLTCCRQQEYADARILLPDEKYRWSWLIRQKCYSPFSPSFNKFTAGCTERTFYCGPRRSFQQLASQVRIILTEVLTISRRGQNQIEGNLTAYLQLMRTT